MDVTVEIAELRVQTESMMTDRVVITRVTDPGGAPVLDPVTGLYPAVPSTDIYTGVCSLAKGMRGQTKSSSGDTVVLLNAILSIPVGGPTLQIRDVVRFTASRFNPALVGAVYIVTSLLPVSHPTRQRVTVEAVVG